MRKGLLIKYIAGEANQKEREEIINWIEKSPDNKEYFIILKNTWISQNMPAEKATTAELNNLRGSINEIRHLDTGGIIPHRAANNGRLFKITTFISTAVAVAAIIMMLIKPSESTIREEYKKGIFAVAMQEYPQAFKHEIYTAKGVKSFITLPDSSKVWLNSDTKIIFPEKFLGNTREVELEGEAYFSVVSDPHKPMIVTTRKGFKVKVFGTEFNLRSYPDEERAITSLYSGKIDLVYGDHGKGEVVKSIQPNEKVVITDNVIEISKPKAISDESAWKDGRLVFEEAKMKDVVKELERWHGVEIVVKDPEILSYSISATFNSESIIQIMDMIKYCILIDYTFESNKVCIFRR